MENLIKMDDLGVQIFSETPISIYMIFCGTLVQGLVRRFILSTYFQSRVGRFFIHLFIGFSIIFPIHFGFFPPIFGNARKIS